MAESSFFCTFFVRLFTAIRESAVVRFITKLFSRIGTALGGCLIGRILCRKTCTDDYTDTSVFYACLRKVWNALLRAFSAAYAWLRRLNEGSLNNRFYERTVKSSYFLHLDTLLVWGIFAIYVVPHDFWNNLFATAFAVLILFVYCLCLYSGRQDIGRRTDGLWFPMLFFISTPNPVFFLRG